MMSCFKFPNSVLTKFQKVILDFWWGTKASFKKTHWVRKEILYQRKLDGGIGLKNMQSFNMALLGKQGWRILMNPDSLLSRVLKKKYFPYCDFLSAPVKSNSSFVWKSIYSAMGILRRGTLYDVTSNSYKYILSSDGKFSVKSVYNFIEKDIPSSLHATGPSSSQHLEIFWKSVWSLLLPRKIKIFIWKAYHNGLPVGSELKKRIGLLKGKCSFCNFNSETSIHIFKDCWWLRSLWHSVGLPSSHLKLQFTSFADWIFLFIIISAS